MVLIKSIVRDVIEKTHNSTERFTREVEKNINIEVEKRRVMLQQLINRDALLVNKQLEARQAIQQIEQHILTVQQVKQITDGYLV